MFAIFRFQVTCEGSMYLTIDVITLWMLSVRVLLPNRATRAIQLGPESNWSPGHPSVPTKPQRRRVCPPSPLICLGPRVRPLGRDRKTHIISIRAHGKIRKILDILNCSAKENSMVRDVHEFKADDPAGWQNFQARDFLRLLLCSSSSSYYYFSSSCSSSSPTFGACISP